MIIELHLKKAFLFLIKELYNMNYNEMATIHSLDCEPFLGRIIVLIFLSPDPSTVLTGGRAEWMKDDLEISNCHLDANSPAIRPN